MGPPNVDCSTTKFVTKCFVIFFVESDEDKEKKKNIHGTAEFTLFDGVETVMPWACAG